MSEEDKLDPNLLTALHIEATNRTTYSVRGLLRYLVYTAISRIVGGAVIWLAFGVGGLADPNGFLLFIGVLVIAVGEVVSAMAALQELKQTEPSAVSLKGISVPKGYRIR